MNILKLIVQIGCLLLLCVIALILCQNRPHRDGGIIPTISAPFIAEHKSAGRWNYDSFEFNGPTIHELGKTLRACLVEYSFKATNSFESEPTRTNRVYDVNGILTHISGDGWEYVWHEGHEYHVRRDADTAWKHSYFLIQYLETPAE